MTPALGPSGSLLGRGSVQGLHETRRGVAWPVVGPHGMDAVLVLVAVFHRNNH